jgi:Primase X
MHEEDGITEEHEERSPVITPQFFSEQIDFILLHLSGPAFPRMASTAATKGGQFMVYSKEELLHTCAKGNYVDCRINAYPPPVEFWGTNRQPPDFIFLDIDELKALDPTLRRIKKELGAAPTVLWSGNGYHLLLPIDCPILEHITEFTKFDRPSELFIRFAEKWLSRGRSDPNHNPSFKSSMIRIPGSYNSKCEAAGRDPEVKIIHRWDGIRAKVTKRMLTEFYTHLVSEKIKEIERSDSNNKSRVLWSSGANANHPKIRWIEDLLRTPIPDYRKHTIALILAPYLINIRKLSYAEAFEIIKAYLDKCDQLSPLDRSSNFNRRIKAALDTAIKNGIPPMSLKTLQSRSPELFSRLVNK